MSHSTTQFGDKKRKKDSFCREGRRGAQGGGDRWLRISIFLDMVDFRI